LIFLFTAKAYKVSLKFLDKYNIGTRASGSLKQHSNSLSNIQNKNLWNDIKDAFSGVYGDNFKRALIENCDSNGVKIDCSILLMLGTAEYSDRLQSNQTCLSSDNNTEYCLIPPKLVVEKKSLEHGILLLNCTSII
ncbi:uncharacterized protein LOC111083999, partial [Limulus polyphemus]|uniref:Uncharacterized protein LOC111083999 n=1 Tax=Limulus polyphemus TaxID=6850 RepID=A0ABM1RYL8_LIMPO